MIVIERLPMSRVERGSASPDEDGIGDQLLQAGSRLQDVLQSPRAGHSGNLSDQITIVRIALRRTAYEVTGVKCP